MNGAIRALKEFLSYEATAGLALMAAAAAALIFDNSGLAPLYHRILTTRVSVEVGTLGLDKPLLLWINDGMMAVFFLLVGLELKREFLSGQLSSRDQLLLPALAALGGMALPSAIYALTNWNDPDLLRGWAIPAATDIAFALGVLGLLGTRAPIAIKVFLLAVAIIDDLGAIIIIALFYTEQLSLPAVALALAALLILLAFNRMKLGRTAPYILVGIALWVFVLKSGVHATLAGVALAFAIPEVDRKGRRPLESLEHALHPYVAFFIMPVFAFANAGVSLTGIGLDTLLQPLPLAIATGLFVGKQAGVFGMVWFAVRSGLAKLPNGTTWAQLYGVSCLAGIGFTMSLFIGTLSFSDPEHAAAVRIGVISGSLLSAVLGYVVLFLAARPATEYQRA